jgi:hypothetical protein
MRIFAARRRITALSHSLLLGLPSHVMQHVTFVDDHGIPHPAAGRLLPGGVECLDDAYGQLNSSSSLRLRESRNFVVVRPVP